MVVQRPDSNRLTLNLQDGPSVTEEAKAEAASVYDDEFMEFDPYLFIRKLPPLDAVVPASRVALLPRQVLQSPGARPWHRGHTVLG